MKFNEKSLKKLLQNEVSEWDSADLSWFDEALFLKLENKQLSQAEHQKMVEMMAHDQAVMNHYLAHKRQCKANHVESAERFFTNRTWAMISLYTCSVVLLLWFIPISTESDFEDFKRGTLTSQIVPVHQAQLDRFPEYFIVPMTDQPIRVDLLHHDEGVWQSEWQQTQRFMLPVFIRNDLTKGKYHWRVVTKDLKIVYQSSFTILN